MSGENVTPLSCNSFGKLGEQLYTPLGSKILKLKSSNTSVWYRASDTKSTFTPWISSSFRLILESSNFPETSNLDGNKVVISVCEGDNAITTSSNS